MRAEIETRTANRGLNRKNRHRDKTQEQAGKGEVRDRNSDNQWHGSDGAHTKDRDRGTSLRLRAHRYLVRVSM
jgi:hypothetical protein